MITIEPREYNEEIRMTENIVGPDEDAKKKKVKIEIRKPDDFKQVYSIGAMGGHSPYDFRIGFYNDTPKSFDSSSNRQIIQRNLETEIILSPIAAVELSRWLNQHIQEYEAVFGPIIRGHAPKKQPRKDDSSELQGYI